MNQFEYDELYQKYLNLLEENACLKAKLKQIEAESGSFTLPEKYQTQELMFEKAQKLETDNQIQENSIKTISIFAKPVHHYSATTDKILLFMSLFK